MEGCMEIIAARYEAAAMLERVEKRRIMYRGVMVY
jgi:hypothetical protein